jgi:hypothetical protein
VVGPDTGPKKAAYLWPSELAAVSMPPGASSLAPPGRRRGRHVRGAGEFAALDCSDDDLEHGTLHIHGSMDRVGHKKKTKPNRSARRLAIRNPSAVNKRWR